MDVDGDAARAPTVAGGDDPGPALAAGTLVDDAFRIERRLGAGGMGTVYLARDVRLGRDVALKIHGTAFAAAAERALREAKVLARLSDPNVVAVHGVGTFDGRVYLAMEYIAGGTLRRWLDERPRGWRDTVAMLERAGRGLAAAHAAGLVHRDFKPENVLVGKDGRVLVADFGLARAADGDGRTLDDDTLPARAPAAAHTGDAPPLGVTEVGTLLGTPMYMSPEQRSGGAIDARSDVYSFCLVAREVLQGKGGPARLHRIIARGLADDPAARWPSMTALLGAVQRTLRRRRRIAIAAGAAAALAVAAAVPLALARRSSAQCSGGAARMGAVWDDARAARVRTGLVAGGLDDAVAAGVIAKLHAFARDWTAREHEACEASRVRGERSARQLEAQSVCFEAARAQLEATAELLERERSASARAPDVAAALPSLAVCTDVRAQSALVLPPAGAAGAMLDPLRKDIAAAGARYVAGLRAEGYDLAVALPARARALGYPPMLAQALFISAQYHAERDQRAVALDELVEAVRVGLASGADVTALAAAHSVGWELAQSGRGAEGLGWFAAARGISERIGQAEERQGRFDTDEAVILRGMGRAADAEPLARSGLARAEQHEGTGSLAYANAHTNLGVVLSDLGRLGEAEDVLRRSVALHEAALGRDHPDSWEATLSLTFTLYREDRYQDALAVIRELVDRMSHRLGPDDHRLARAVQVEGGILLDLGDVAGALRANQRALDLSARSPTPDPAWRGGLLGNMAMAQAGSGELPAAIALARRSLEEFRKAHDGDHVDLVAPHQILGTMLRMAAELDESEARLREALAMAERTMPFDRPERVNASVELAMTELARGRAAPAADRIDLVLPLLERPDGAPLNLAEARFALARSSWAAGRDRKRARALAEAARDGYAQLGPGFEPTTDEIVAWLATHRR